MIKIPLVDLRAGYESIRLEIDEAIHAVIEASAFVGRPDNEFVQRFETKFADHVGARHCIACANGTDALEVALKVIGVGPGDEVIVPAMSWISTSEAVTSVGAEPVFVDILDGFLTMDPSLVEARLGRRTKAVIVVHLYGQCARLAELSRIASAHGAVLIEDCAQAHGARYHGKHVGTFGSVGCFSFFPSKNLGAFGDAGAIVTDDEGLARLARMICQHGQGSRRHDHEIEGRNSRMDGIQAAILEVKLRYLDGWVQARQERAAYYVENLSKNGVVTQTREPDCTHAYHLLIAQLPARDRVAAMLTSRGIGVGIQYPCPLPLLRAYARLGHGPAEFPVAVALAKCVLSLPLYPELTRGQQDSVLAELFSAQDT